MIVLSDDALLVRLDPGHGGEVLDLVELASGRQLLGRASFATEPPRPGDLDDETWSRSYRGGWQLLIPNAGNVCDVAGVRHGFHGRGSNDPWTVVESGPASCRLAWTGHGLRVERELTLAGGALVVATAVAAAGDEPAPFVAVEHVALGVELFDPAVEIQLPGGRAYELSEATGPSVTPVQAPEWPSSLLLDGAVEQADRWPIAEPRSRYGVVVDLPEGSARVVNTGNGQALRFTWDVAMLPHAWIWHELRRYPGLWRGQAEVLVVEPASVPHGLGLAEAIARGQARFAEPGAPAQRWSLELRPEQS